MSVTSWFAPEREAQLRTWVSATALGLHPATLQLAAADASPRRYWRVQGPSGSRIVMDAPPAHNTMTPFLEVLARLRATGLHAPELLAQDVEQGFLLLEDLGTETYLRPLQQADAVQADQLMRAAFQSLVTLQSRGVATGLPTYDEALIRRELQLFPDWCVQREFGRSWTAQQQKYWDMVCAALVPAFAAQPQVLVHRDFMPRNLMLPLQAGGAPGLLDFQDAVQGPAGYDVASLLRDAFHSWDEERELDWAVRYWEAARKAGIAWSADFGECWRAIEWCALQRHLKILGIFCRLKHRDGKPHYAEDLPRFFAYATKTAARYRELKPLLPLLEELRPGLTTTAVTLR